MLHAGDSVEEIATKRQGIVREVLKLKTDTLRWRVEFLHNRKLEVNYFTNVAELRLVRCPHKKR
jgi:hypothetical protein